MMNSKKSKKTEVFSFDCNIYPRMLWVATSFGELKQFVRSYDDGTEETLDKIDDNNAAAITDHIFMPSIDRGGVIIRFRSKKDMTPDVVAHEATHAAIMIFDYCGCRISPDNQEPFAYLVGWIVECCMKAKKDTGGVNNETSTTEEV